MPTSLIIGVASQDGSYLAEYLLSKKYTVIGTTRAKGDELSNISQFRTQLTLEKADLTDYDSFSRIIQKYQPHEIYNLAALTNPDNSWDQVYETGRVNALGPVLVLEAIKNFSPQSRFFQASSREIFGTVTATSASETTHFRPENPYATAKTYAHFMTQIYRGQGIFACCGILFNHDSPRHSPLFVTHKITAAAACIKNQNPVFKLHLWDTTSSRDRGYAKEYVQAMWLMLQNKEPKDYVIATGELHTVAEICDIAFSRVGLNWQDYVVVDDHPDTKLTTPGLKGDSSAIRRDLGWSPKTSFRDLITLMVDSDLQKLKT